MTCSRCKKVKGQLVGTLSGLLCVACADEIGFEWRPSCCEEHCPACCEGCAQEAASVVKPRSGER